MMADTVKLVADRLRKVEVKSPAELIIGQVRELIAEGVLKPGQKLPSERIMSERFAVSRGIVREALRKLESYGVVRTLPQSGSVIEDLGATTLLFLVDNILEMPAPAYATLAEARLVIESHAARLAALNATAAQKRGIRQVHEGFAAAAAEGRTALEENMLLHLRIAGASGNAVLRSFVSQIEPEIMKLSIQLDAYRSPRISEVTAEHEEVIRAIEAGDGEAAADAMARHLDNARRQDAKLIAENEEDSASPPAGRRTRRRRKE